jgi:hypothetical protein
MSSMEPQEMDAEEFAPLLKAFQEQLQACLDECAEGRHGLFGEPVHMHEEDAWPEAVRLRELAGALQAILAQTGERNALCEEFLDLCTMHGEGNLDEPRLARAFINRIDSGDVGMPTQNAEENFRAKEKAGSSPSLKKLENLG